MVEWKKTLDIPVSGNVNDVIIVDGKCGLHLLYMSLPSQLEVCLLHLLYYFFIQAKINFVIN